MVHFGQSESVTTKSARKAKQYGYDRLHGGGRVVGNVAKRTSRLPDAAHAACFLGISIKFALSGEGGALAEAFPVEREKSVASAQLESEFDEPREGKLSCHLNEAQFR